MFNPDMMIFECISENNNYNGSRGFSKSYSSHFFEVGTQYKGYMSYSVSSNNYGELEFTVTIDILDGGCDGYDTPSGVWFESLEHCNKYFKVIEE